MTITLFQCCQLVQLIFLRTQIMGLRLATSYTRDTCEVICTQLWTKIKIFLIEKKFLKNLLPIWNPTHLAYHKPVLCCMHLKNPTCLSYHWYELWLLTVPLKYHIYSISLTLTVHLKFYISPISLTWTLTVPLKYHISPMSLTWTFEISHISHITHLNSDFTSRNSTIHISPISLTQTLTVTLKSHMSHISLTKNGVNIIWPHIIQI